MNTNVLCVDIGTSSLKAALISKRGQVEAFSRQAIASGSFAAESWMHALASAVKSFPRCKIHAVCVSGNGPTVVSNTGRTLLWNEPLDEECRSILSKLPEICQNSLFVPRLIAFKHKYADTWRKEKHLFGCPEYVIWRLTGNALTILPEERFREAYWNGPALAAADFTADEMSKFPPFMPSAGFAGKVQAEAASFTGIKAGTKVYCGAPDFVATLIGTNTLRSGDMCDRAGSSEGINLCTSVPVYGKNIRTLPSIIPGLWNASYLISDSGTLFSKLREKVQFQTGKTYSNQALVEEIIEHGGAHLPIPLAVEGQELISRLAQELKAAVATLTYAAFRTHVDTPEGKAFQSVPLPNEMTLSGGQASNEVWSRYKCSVADITGKVPFCTDAELMGDNILARVGMKEYKSIQQAANVLIKIEKSYFPSSQEL
ncbi:MAG: hypothetical protein K6G80_08650 [Treponema sp.]|nr:hypothetical protein [Treponema sp.]